MNTRPPQSPLYRLIDLEEKAIASLLLAHDIVTPATLAGDVSDGGRRRGFVQLLVYNPHDLAFYCKFLRSPFLSAVEAGTLGDDSPEPAEVRSAVRDILVRYDETLARIAGHAHRLARADKLLPLNFLGESNERRQSIEWLSELCDRGSLREWFDLNLYQLFPLAFADVFAEDVFRGMRPAEPQSFTISQIARDIVARRAAAARGHAHPALGDYLELSHILDFLLFGSWVDRTVDYRRLLPLFGESWEAGARYLTTCKRTFQRVRLPIWYPHSVLGILVVGWEGAWRKSDRQLVELLAGHTASVGSELRRLRTEVATRRLQHDRDAVVDATIDLIGCRAGTIVDCGRERPFTVTPASDELFDVRHVAGGRRRNDAARRDRPSIRIDLPRRGELEIHYEPLVDCDNSEFVGAHQEKLVWDISAALGQAAQADPAFDRARLDAGVRELGRMRGTGESIAIGTAAALVVADLISRWLAAGDLAEIPPGTELRLLAKQSHQKREGIAYAVVNRTPDASAGLAGFWWTCADEPATPDGLDAAARADFEQSYLLTTDIKQAAYFLREAAERREFVEFFARQGLWVGTLNSKNQRLSGNSGAARASGNICWIAIRNAADAGRKRVTRAEAGATELLAVACAEPAAAQA